MNHNIVMPSLRFRTWQFHSKHTTLIRISGDKTMLLSFNRMQKIQDQFQMTAIPFWSNDLVGYIKVNSIGRNFVEFVEGPEERITEWSLENLERALPSMKDKEIPLKQLNVQAQMLVVMGYLTMRNQQRDNSIIIFPSGYTI